MKRNTYRILLRDGNAKLLEMPAWYKMSEFIGYLQAAGIKPGEVLEATYVEPEEARRLN